MARVKIDILGIRELKWTGMGEFNSNDHYIYYCGQESLRGNESESEVAQSCPSLCDPMDCNRSGSSVHGIFQAIALEWIAISFSSRSSRPSSPALQTDALPSEPLGKYAEEMK